MLLKNTMKILTIFCIVIFIIYYPIFNLNNFVANKRVNEHLILRRSTNPFKLEVTNINYEFFDDTYRANEYFYIRTGLFEYTKMNSVENRPDIEIKAKSLGETIHIVNERYSK
jgi:hypothetical protein